MRLLPNPNRLQVLANARLYSGVLNTPMVVPDFDALVLQANGWLSLDPLVAEQSWTLADALGNITGFVGSGGNVSTFAGPSYTWSTKPSAPSMQGYVIYISDIGPAGSEWISDGTNWRPVAPFKLAGSPLAVAYSITNPATQTVVTQTIRGGVVHPNGSLTVNTVWSVTTWTSGYLGVTVRLAGTQYHNYTPVPASAPSSYGDGTVLRNRNASNSQVWLPAGFSFGVGGGAGALVTSAVDLSSDQSLTLVVVNQTGLVAGNLEAWEIWVS
jgi:hypothetical protein